MAGDAAAPEGELSDLSATEETSSATEAETGAGESPEVTNTDTTPDCDGDHGETLNEHATETGVAREAPPARQRMSYLRLAMIAGLASVMALASLAGWLSYRTYESHQVAQQRTLFLEAGRQGALNLTTIDWQEAEQDVQRILDSATGSFYDDFQKRARQFVEVVKRAQSKSVGTIAEAGLESVSDSGAQVLVVLTVKTSNEVHSINMPRAWRLRISVGKVGNEAKVSNVEFMP